MTTQMEELVAQSRSSDASRGATQARDYDVICKAIRYLSEHRIDQPGLAELSRHLSLDPTTCHKLFKRWCGLSPKEFLQAITLDYAQSLLSDSASVLDAALTSGLSGGGRLHDLSVTYQALTPGEIKQRGQGVTFAYGIHETPFGLAVAIATPRGLTGLAFANDDRDGSVDDALGEFQQRWPAAEFEQHANITAPYVEAAFGITGFKRPEVIRLVLIGTDFEIRIWETLLKVPLGGAVSYRDIAQHLGMGGAARAVGRAVGANPISFVVPCHRVLRQDGGLGGYHWGVTRKRAIIGWEAGARRQLQSVQKD